MKKIVAHFGSNNFDRDVKNMISLFGITGEELSEAGASYEDLRACRL